MVVLANRLPIEPPDRRAVSRSGRDAPPTWRTALGGMVTALQPVVEASSSTWIGWDRDVPGVPGQHLGVTLVPIHLPKELARDYYEGFANSSLWPLYHDLGTLARFDDECWLAYHAVNKLFAAEAVRAVDADPEAIVWVQDYQLQLVPAMVREAKRHARIGFFLHIPVPTVKSFRRLPHGEEILHGLLGADLIGVQRTGDAEALLELFKQVLGLQVQGETVRIGSRSVMVRAFASSVDVKLLTGLARTAQTRREMVGYRDKVQGRQVILAVERLDYTKGVEQRLEVYRQLLHSGRIDPAETVLVQVLPPSRQDIPEYGQLSERVSSLVRRINDEFGREDRPAVVYWDRSLTLDELVPLYRIADVMAVTPLRDGMNLVAKEYVASRVDLGGALVLSEHCGAADELQRAYLVDPYDADELQETLLRALHASADEKAARMRSMRTWLLEHDAQRWGREFLGQLRQLTDERMSVPA